MLAIKTWQALQHWMLEIKTQQAIQHQVIAIKIWQALQHQMLAIKASFPIPDWFSFFVQNATQHMSAPALVWL
jgi:predicted DCC family thiol-disulfide oxidoreductase YuxK